MVLTPGWPTARPCSKLPVQSGDRSRRRRRSKWWSCEELRARTWPRPLRSSQPGGNVTKLFTTAI